MLQPAHRSIPLAKIYKVVVRGGKVSVRNHSAQAAISSASQGAWPATGSSSGPSTPSRPSEQASTVAAVRLDQPTSQRMSIFDVSDLQDPPSAASKSAVRPSPTTARVSTPLAFTADSSAAAAFNRPPVSAGNSKLSIFDVSELYEPVPNHPNPDPDVESEDIWHDDAPANISADRYPKLGYRNVLHSEEHSIDVGVSSPDGNNVFWFQVRADGPNVEPVTVSARWVRDSDISTRSIDPHTRQKIHSSGNPEWAKGLQLRSSPVPVRLLLPEEDSRVSELALEIFWEPAKGEKEYSSIIPVSFLRRRPRRSLVGTRKLWAREQIVKPKSKCTGSEPELKEAMSIEYDSFQTPAGLKKALMALSEFGLVFLRGVPTEMTDDAGCELRKVATRIGGLRNTFYGQTWDVKALGAQGRNVAYTNVDLGLHMDLLYFENPPQIQLLHCLRNRVVSGGDSYFVDAFRAAYRLKHRMPVWWDLLTKAQIPYHYKNDKHHFEFSHPVFQLGLRPQGDPDGNPPAFLRHVNWSPPFQAPLPTFGSKRVLDAMAAFDKELRRPEVEYKTRMQEGDLVIFDNRRILHARTAFVEPLMSAEPSRWLKGGYVDGDAAWDILRVLSAQPGLEN